MPSSGAGPLICPGGSPFRVVRLRIVLTSQGLCARHPSQLYEAALEGLVLGLILLWLVWRRGGLKAPGLVSGTFFLGYGAARFFVEFFRQADAQFISPDNPMGYVLHWGGIGVSMGQLLSLPMIVLGLGLITWSRRSRAA